MNYHPSVSTSVRERTQVSCSNFVYIDSSFVFCSSGLFAWMQWMFTTCDFFLASWNMISDLQEIGQDPEPSCSSPWVLQNSYKNFMCCNDEILHGEFCLVEFFSSLGKVISRSQDLNQKPNLNSFCCCFHVICFSTRLYILVTTFVWTNFEPFFSSQIWNIWVFALSNLKFSNWTLWFQTLKTNTRKAAEFQPLLTGSLNWSHCS
jgi:hypothetical protein